MFVENSYPALDNVPSRHIAAQIFKLFNADDNREIPSNTMLLMVQRSATFECIEVERSQFLL